MRAFALLISSACVWQMAEATTLQQLTLEELVQKSTAIVRGKVIGVSGMRRGPDVFTVYRFETLETLKRQQGVAPREVGVPGGVAGGIRQVVAGAPVLRAGQEYIFFLWTGNSGLAQLTGMSQGLFTISRTAVGDVISTRAVTGERMLDGAGHAARDEALALPWSELRSRISRALSASSVAAGNR
jgi:hypothetical protein